MTMPMVPAGNGKHPVLMVVLSSNNLAASTAFYAKVFGWQMHSMSAELTAAITPGGPTVTLRANVPEGFPGMVPYIGVNDVEEALARVIEAGGTVERAPWSIPMVGKLARFREHSGTIYGLMQAMAPAAMPPMPMPFGSNPKPPAGAVCSLEMYAAEGADTAGFFGGLFGWGTLVTMPRYLGFDAGAGAPGVFQSHTPALPAVAYIYVLDVAAKLAEIDAAGGKRMGEPMPIPGMGCFGYFTDPSGTTMGLIGP
jgi:uncharacterized protein